jgi:multiple sugar transport system ATP-binding protein
MNVGRIQQIAPPLEVYHRPANLFVAGFIGSPRMNTVRGKLAGQGDEVVFTEETARGGEPMELHFLGEKARGLAKLVGRDVILGLRPENIGYAVGGGDAGATFAARVDVVEPVGPETWIYLSTDSHQLISRISGTAKPTAVGETMRCQADLERACFFDPGSGEALA